MASSEPAGYVVPNPRIPKTIGILNIVFATCLMVCGLCTSVYIFLMPALMKSVQQMQKSVEAKQQAQRQATIDELAAKEKAAESEAEKTLLREQRKAIESEPKPPNTAGMFDLSSMGLNDPKFIAYIWTDMLSGVIVNVVLLISGIGLVTRKRWAPTLGTGIAWVKIVRLFLVYGFFAFAVVPSLSRNVGKALGEMMAQQQQAAGGPAGAAVPTDLLVRTYTIMYTVYAVGLIVFGSIYPAVSIWLLSKPVRPGGLFRVGQTDGAERQVVNVATILLGPLVGPECRRAVARGWLILVRALAALAIMGTVFIVVWYWWINQQMDMDYQPYTELRVGLVAIEGMAVTIALLMAPAVLAGSIAGEKSRGSMGLLLTTRVTPREIIAARLTGKLTQVAMILLAGAPGLVLIAALAGFEAPALALLAALPAAVAIGGGGIAILASTVVRRGRDALLAVYLLDFLFLLTPLSNYFGLPSEISEWFSALDPFSSLYELAYHDKWLPALLTSALWFSMGLVSASLASWRLRPACLALVNGERVAKRTRRRWHVPPLGDRPMLWKELYIERAATLGRIGRWIGLVAVVALAGGSLALAGVVLCDLFVNGQTIWADWATGVLAVAIDGPALYVSWLIQWAIGLRAAATISSERERGTWDALLTSPLSGREIIWGKLWGSLFALRWVLLATFVAWTVTVIAGAMPLREYIRQVATTLILGCFMAAVGVRTSLSSATATRSMSLTIGAWLVGWVVIAIVSACIIAAVAILSAAVWAIFAQFGLVTWGAGPWFPMSMRVAWPLTTLSLFALSVVAIAGDTSLRFDRIAGRLTEGKVAGAVDRIVYGPAFEPVAVGADGRLMEPAVTIDQGREEAVSRPS